LCPVRGNEPIAKTTPKANIVPVAMSICIAGSQSDSTVDKFSDIDL